MQRTLISSLAMVAALMSVGNGVFAHDDAVLDKTSGSHGGQLRMAGSYHFELVVAKDSKEAKDNGCERKCWTGSLGFKPLCVEAPPSAFPNRFPTAGYVA